MISLIRQWWRRLVESRATPIALLVIFAFLIVITINHFSVWIDESATLVMVGDHDYGTLLRYTKLDAHPPLWYLLLKPWLQLFGASALASRAQSAVFMLAAFAAWYRFAATRFSRPTALLSLAFLVTNPMLLHYAIEGRMYAFGVLLTALSCLLITGTYKWRWYAYWVCAVAMLWTHYFLSFIVAAQFAYLLLRRRDQQLSLRWIIVYGASIVVAFLPWVPFALAMTSSVVGNGFWIPPMVPSRVTGYVLHAFLHRLDVDLEGIRMFPALAFFTALGATLLRAGRERRDGCALLWLLAAVPWLFLLALSAKVPIFHPRYVIFGLPALITLMAMGALLLTPRWRVLAIVVVLVGQIAGYVHMRDYGVNDSWRRYWSMKWVAREVARPVDGEKPLVVCASLFPFMDAKVTLKNQAVIHYRDYAPDNGFPDIMYHDHPEWYVMSLDGIHARHVWLLDEILKPPVAVPDNWKLEVTHNRGYVRTRLFRVD